MTGWAAAPPVERLGDLVAHHAARRSDAEALIAADRTLTYGELDALVARCTAALVAAGVTRGARVAMRTPPCWEQVVVFLACARLGAPFVGLDPRQPPRELAHVLHDAAPVRCIGTAPGDAAASSLHALLDAPDAPPAKVTAACDRVRPEDPVAVVYTSGSTGTRKGALIGGAGLLHAFWPGNGALELSAPIRCLNDLPVDHLGGLVERVLPPLLSGGAVVLHERFDPGAFLRDAARHRVTYLHGEVTQWLRCVALDAFDATDLSSVEVALYTGAAAPAALLERLAARFPRVATGYGLTETCGPVTLAGAVAPGAPAGLVGTPIRGVELRVVDDHGHSVPTEAEGRIRVRGRTLTPGYLGRPDATRALIDPDGWLETGDRGALLPDGALRLAGRSSDMYKSGGHSIYPREVEVVLEAHRGVAHAAVVGVPDPLFQEVGAAFVVAQPESRLDAPGLDAFCRERLASYKVPKAFHVVPDLPLLEIGKVDRRALRRRHDEGTTHPDRERSTK